MESKKRNEISINNDDKEELLMLIELKHIKFNNFDTSVLDETEAHIATVYDMVNRAINYN